MSNSTDKKNSIFSTTNLIEHLAKENNGVIPKELIKLIKLINFEEIITKEVIINGYPDSYTNILALNMVQHLPQNLLLQLVDKNWLLFNTDINKKEYQNILINLIYSGYFEFAEKIVESFFETGELDLSYKKNILALKALTLNNNIPHLLMNITKINGKELTKLIFTCAKYYYLYKDKELSQVSDNIELNLNIKKDNLYSTKKFIRQSLIDYPINVRDVIILSSKFNHTDLFIGFFELFTFKEQEKILNDFSLINKLINPEISYNFNNNIIISKEFDSKLPDKKYSIIKQSTNLWKELLTNKNDKIIDYLIEKKHVIPNHIDNNTTSTIVLTEALLQSFKQYNISFTNIPFQSTSNMRENEKYNKSIEKIDHIFQLIYLKYGSFDCASVQLTIPELNNTLKSLPNFIIHEKYKEHELIKKMFINEKIPHSNLGSPLSLKQFELVQFIQKKTEISKHSIFSSFNQKPQLTLEEEEEVKISMLTKPNIHEIEKIKLENYFFNEYINNIDNTTTKAVKSYKKKL